MTTFNQQGQHVCGNQYNTGRDMVITELQNLQTEVTKAIRAGTLNDKIAAEVESKINSDIVQAQKPKPEKKTIVEYLDEAKKLIEGLTSASGLVAAIIKTADLVRTVFL